MLWSSIALQSQRHVVDSLGVEIEKEKNDSAKLILRTRFALENAKIDFDAARKELEEIKKIHYLNRKRYGSQRISRELEASLFYASEKLIRKLMYRGYLQNVL